MTEDIIDAEQGKALYVSAFAFAIIGVETLLHDATELLNDTDENNTSLKSGYTMLDEANDCLGAFVDTGAPIALAALLDKFHALAGIFDRLDLDGTVSWELSDSGDSNGSDIGTAKSFQKYW